MGGVFSFRVTLLPSVLAFFLELVTVALPSSASRAGAGNVACAGVDRSPWGGLEGAAAPHALLAMVWQLVPREAL